MESSSANSSNQNPRWKYDVFLSFRGKDTRYGFIEHLYKALKDNGILTFRDDEELERGEALSPQLFQAIKESLFAIVILSPNYHSSSWCLTELQEILETRTDLGGQTFPVFYGVDPCNVRYQKDPPDLEPQKESYAEIFKKYEQRFDIDKVRKWKEALTKVANLRGWHYDNRGEVELIEQIVQVLRMKVQPLRSSLSGEIVGIDPMMEEIYSLLKLNEMNDVRFIGIWGMGGAGKTTLARIVYERIKNQFDGSCFLQHVREFFEKKDGLVKLQRKVLLNLNVKGMEIYDSYRGEEIIRRVLCNRRILFILDDVNDYEQLKNLAGDEKWFGKGSRVIVTTRDKHLMKTYGNLAFNYEVGLLNSDESLELFFRKSFKDQFDKEFSQLSEDVVQYVGGLPLALVVAGSFLRGRSKIEWEDYLDSLKKGPQDKIFNILRLSYDGLENAHKSIFLDIACFFNGWDKDHVTRILRNCGHHAIIGIEVLIERSLLTYDGEDLGMHDLIQNMGKRIVLDESSDDCRRSRLWSITDVKHVLEKNQVNEVIQGIVLNSSEPCEGHWNSEDLSKLRNLKLLILRTSLHFCNNVNYLSNKLRVLEWEGCHLESLAPCIELNKLVDLKLHHSKIKQLWRGIKYFQELKFMDLSHSKCLTQTPDVSGVPNLETMVFEGCITLLEVHQSTGEHKKLVILSLEGCVNLEILPKKLETNSLKKFILSGCSKVKKLPEFGDGMENLLVLDLKDCKSLRLPNSDHYLKSLQILNISGCSQFSSIPNNLNEIEDLEELDISGTAIRVEPSYLFHLKNSIGLLSSISQMSMLRELDLSYCNLVDGSIFDHLSNLSSLWKLNLGGNNFVNLPTHSIAHLPKLYMLFLHDCARLESLPILPPSLSFMVAEGCASMNFESYVQQLYDFFSSMSPNFEMRDTEPFFNPPDIPGSEIPSWFVNQNYCCKDFLISAFPSPYPYGRYDSVVSITVDIPNHCRSGRPWGIAVCLLVELVGNIVCIFKAPEDDYIVPFDSDIVIGTVKCANLVIHFLPGELPPIKKILERDTNQLELLFCSNYLPLVDVEGRGWRKIRKCGCRLLCQEDGLQEDDVTLSNPRLRDEESCIKMSFNGSAIPIDIPSVARDEDNIDIKAKEIQKQHEEVNPMFPVEKEDEQPVRKGKSQRKSQANMASNQPIEKKNVASLHKLAQTEPLPTNVSSHDSQIEHETRTKQPNTVTKSIPPNHLNQNTIEKSQKEIAFEEISVNETVLGSEPQIISEMNKEAEVELPLEFDSSQGNIEGKKVEVQQSKDSKAMSEDEEDPITALASLISDDEEISIDSESETTSRPKAEHRAKIELAISTLGSILEDDLEMFSKDSEKRENLKSSLKTLQDTTEDDMAIGLKYFVLELGQHLPSMLECIEKALTIEEAYQSLAKSLASQKKELVAFSKSIGTRKKQLDEDRQKVETNSQQILATEARIEELEKELKELKATQLNLEGAMKAIDLENQMLKQEAKNAMNDFKATSSKKVRMEIECEIMNVAKAQTLVKWKDLKANFKKMIDSL